MAVEKATSVVGYSTQAYVSNQDKKIEKANVAEQEKDELSMEKARDKFEKSVTLQDHATEDVPEDEIKKANEQDQRVLHERIKKALDNYSSRMGNFEAKFGVHEETNRVTIKLVDKDTQEVLKEIPPEKTLDMIAKCLEIAGVLVDEKI